MYGWDPSISPNSEVLEFIHVYLVLHNIFIFLILGLIFIDSMFGVYFWQNCSPAEISGSAKRRWDVTRRLAMETALIYCKGKCSSSVATLTFEFLGLYRNITWKFYNRKRSCWSKINWSRPWTFNFDQRIPKLDDRWNKKTWCLCKYNIIKNK